jgi:hypothetical protein
MLSHLRKQDIQNNRLVNEVRVQGARRMAEVERDNAELRLEIKQRLFRNENEMRSTVNERLVEMSKEFMDDIKAESKRVFHENFNILLSRIEENEESDKKTNEFLAQLDRANSDMVQQNMRIQEENENIKQIFKDESEHFFSERLKWKSDLLNDSKRNKELLDKALHDSELALNEARQ